MFQLRVITTAVRRRWGHRSRFERLRDWGMTGYDALLRYFKRFPLPLRGKPWPVRLRSVREPVFVRLGTSDGAVLEEVFVRDVYQSVTAATLGNVERVVDLGANVGLSARLWLERFPKARVVAVEPDEENVAACRMNTVCVADRIVLVKACVAVTSGVVHLNRSRDACAYQMTRDITAMGAVPVPAKAVPEILSEFDGPATVPIDLLKVDIEGAEQELFQDCRAWIHRVQAMMIELHPPYTQEMFLRDLAGADSRLDLIDSRIVSGNPLLFLRRNVAALEP